MRAKITRLLASRGEQRAFTSGTPLRELLAVDPQTAALDLDAIFDYGAFTRYAGEIVGRRDAFA